jgi:hypothetical protein
VERRRLGDAGRHINTDWSHAPFASSYHDFTLQGRRLRSLHAEATRRQPEEDDDASLRTELLHLRIRRPTLVFTKPLSQSHSDHNKARLILPEKLVIESPLLGMLTTTESRLMFRTGLPVSVFHRHDHAYGMTL